MSTILHTLKEKKITERICSKSCDIIIVTFKQKVTVTKFREDSKIKISRKFKVEKIALNWT